MSSRQAPATVRRSGRIERAAPSGGVVHDADDVVLIRPLGSWAPR